MLKNTVKFLWRFAFLLIIALFMPKIVVLTFASPRTFRVENVPPARVAIVFGAGLLRNGSAGPVLRDRVETAVKLYQ